VPPVAPAPAAADRPGRGPTWSGRWPRCSGDLGIPPSFVEHAGRAQLLESRDATTTDLARPLHTWTRSGRSRTELTVAQFLVQSGCYRWWPATASGPGSCRQAASCRPGTRDGACSPAAAPAGVLQVRH
jgi:hypothetical protein